MVATQPIPALCGRGGTVLALQHADRMVAARERDDGFSLIEVLVAALVLCVGMAGVFPLLFGSVRATRAARDASMATWLAWQKAEQLRAPADLAVSPANTLAVDTAGYVDYPDQAGRPGNAPGPYTRRWLIEDAGVAGNGALRLVVSVFHAASRGRPVVVATVRRRGGV